MPPIRYLQNTQNELVMKDLPDGKKTFTAYLWMVCSDAYDQNNG